MKQFSFSLGLIALMMSTSTAVETESADTLVAKGQQLHSGREYDLAARAFESAIKLESCPKSAHYHLARSLAMKLSADRENWDEIEGETSLGTNQSDPYEALARAIKLDPGTARRAATDWNFIHIRLTPRFQMLIGADLKDKELVKLLLIANSIWYSPPHGTWNGNDLRFLETGEVLQRIYTQNEDGGNTLRFHNGRFGIDDKGDINVTFQSGQVFRGRFIEDGTLELVGEKTTNYTCYPVHDV